MMRLKIIMIVIIIVIIIMIIVLLVFHLFSPILSKFAFQKVKGHENIPDSHN